MRNGMVAGLIAGAVACMPATADAGQAGLPAHSTLGIARVAVLCLLEDAGLDRLKHQATVCEQVRAIAAAGAPVPVSTIGFGDPVLLERDVLGVLVHVAVDRSGARPLAVLHVRPYRAEPGASVLFGAAPVALPLAADGTLPHAALAAALDKVLPWRMRPAR